MSNWIFNGGVVPQLTTKNGGIAPAPAIIAPTAPHNTTAKQPSTPAVAPALPTPSSIVPAATTQGQINTLFRIVNGTDNTALQQPVPIESPPPPVIPPGGQ